MDEKIVPSGEDVLAACEVLNALAHVGDEQMLEFAPSFGRIVRAWVASLDLGEQE